jgi:hypothetical protein
MKQQREMGLVDLKIPASLAYPLVFLLQLQSPVHHLYQR